MNALVKIKSTSLALLCSLFFQPVFAQQLDITDNFSSRWIELGQVLKLFFSEPFNNSTIKVVIGATDVSDLVTFSSPTELRLDPGRHSLPSGKRPGYLPCSLTHSMAGISAAAAAGAEPGWV